MFVEALHVRRSATLADIISYNLARQFKSPLRDYCPCPVSKSRDTKRTSSEEKTKSFSEVQATACVSHRSQATAASASSLMSRQNRLRGFRTRTCRNFVSNRFDCLMIPSFPITRSVPKLISMCCNLAPWPLAFERLKEALKIFWKYPRNSARNSLCLRNHSNVAHACWGSRRLLFNKARWRKMVKLFGLLIIRAK